MEVRLSEPGEDTDMLYTDGLVERRGERLATRLDQLQEVAAEASFDPDLLCDAVIEGLAGSEAAADDIAVLAVQRLATADRALSLTVATRAEELAAIRRLLRSWLADAGAPRPRSGRCFWPAARHARTRWSTPTVPVSETFDLTAERDADSVVLTITDRGQWRPPRGTNRGRGLGLMERFMDDVDVVPGEQGTTVRMRRRLTG